MIATKILPEGFSLRREINLQEDQALLIKLNLWGLVSLPLVGYILLWLGLAFHPEFQSLFQVMRPQIPIPIQILELILGLIAITVLHELVHGAFFWIITHQFPKFGFRGAYAFAAAPDWYIPRGSYFLVGAAPLVIISLIGIFCIPFIPAHFMLTWLFCLLANASGAVGDVYILSYLMRQPTTVVIQDRGDRISVFADAIA
jgi:Putative zincin peptidase